MNCFCSCDGTLVHGASFPTVTGHGDMKCFIRDMERFFQGHGAIMLRTENVDYFSSHYRTFGHGTFF
jgi:hypothetical protein